MDLDLNPFNDIHPQPARNARAVAKFQLKPKAQPRKEKHTSSNLTNAAKDIPVKTTNVHQDSSHSSSLRPMPDKVASVTTLTDPLPELQDQEPLDSTVIIHSELPHPDGGISAPVDITSPHLMDQESADFQDSAHLGCTIFDNHGNIQSGRETADVLFGLDDFLDGSATTNVSRLQKLSPRIRVNVQAEDKPPVSCDVDTGAESFICHAKVFEGGPERTPSDTFPEYAPEETENSRDTGAFDHEEDFLLDVGRLGREEQAFPGFGSLDVNPNTTGGAHLFSSETEYRDDDLNSASVDHDFSDLSTITASHPAVLEHLSGFPAGEYLLHADTSPSSPPLYPEAESQAVPIIFGKESSRSRKQKSSTTLREADERNEPRKSSMQLRKRLTAPVLADRMEGGTEEDMVLLAEPSDDSFVNEDVDSAGDDDYHEDTSCRKRAAKKAKTAVQNGKSGQRRLVSSDKPDSSSQEPPKKKFSHSTRRTRRQLNKVLLETPEDEIDYTKLSIKDIIRLGEIREERTKKDAATATRTLLNQSASSSFEAAPYNDDDPFGLNADVDETPLPKHNYHSFMKKIPKKKWSKQDTKLFYEAIRQFGTDFGMIEQVFPDNHDLFPNRHHKRRQLILKFKNEERRHPMELHDALTKRTKSRSHFEMVIEKLKRAAAAQAEENCERDDDDDVEMEDDPEANVCDENTHADRIEEDENAHNWSPSKKDNFDFGENTHGIEHYDEDDYDWSQSKNEYGGY